MSQTTVAQSGPTTLDRTWFAVRAALGRTDGRLVFAGVGLAYLLTYLYAIGDLAAGGYGLSVRVVADPLGTALTRTGPTAFEPVALVDTGVFIYEFSPVNLLIGAGVAVLVAVNLAVSYLAWRQPKACGITPGAGRFRGSGVLGAIPALLSGSACCGPIVLIVVGIQASTALVTLFNVLLPIAVVLLVGSLLYVGRQVDPKAV